MPNPDYGHYTGKLIFEPLADGRRMRVLQDFGFMEADGLHWPVPPRTIVDGASITRPLWSLIGGPFEGKYRDASVVHDYYCDVRSAEWQMVHRMFYRGILASGVSVAQAKLMYGGVYFGGPRWGITVVENVTLGKPAVPSKEFDDSIDNRMLYIATDEATLAVSTMIERDGMSAFDWVATGKHDPDPKSEATLDLQKLAAFIVSENPSITKLEAALDEALQFVLGSDEVARKLDVGNLTSLK
jgi:hypothetical protein